MLQKEMREIISVSTITVIFIIFPFRHLSEASVIDSKYIEVIGLQDCY